MTFAWCVLSFCAGWFSLVAVQSASASIARRRLPVQVIAGHVFPHPQDDGWIVTQGRAVHGRVALSRQWTPHDVTYHWIRVGDVAIDEGARVRKYMEAVEDAHRERMIAKALEGMT